VVQIHPDPPTDPLQVLQAGAIAQLGERLLCKQEVTGSIPVGSTSLRSYLELSAKRSAPSFRRKFHSAAL
jgi:hypothetical protein